MMKSWIPSWYGILGLQLILQVSVDAQIIPKGMNYQAIARNAKGDILANQKISLKIYLFGNENNQRTNHFTEIHEATTNATGLFNLIIGEGTKIQGEFGLIPWNTQNIWMEVAIKGKTQTQFTTVSHSKLLAVPYAIHAGTAGKLSDVYTTSAGSVLPDPGVISTQWSVFGNANTDSSGNPYHINSLGTTDKVDLFLITDNVERLRFLHEGDIITKLNFNVGQNLKVGQNLFVLQSANVGDSLSVKKNVLFNTLAGSTINFGPFTVERGSLTLLSGKFTVGRAMDLNAVLNVDGPTDLNDSLTVTSKSATKLTGTLQVDSVTVLNDDLNVNDLGSTSLTGTLLVDSMATYHEKVKILSTYSTDTSGAVPTGALQVLGGTYIRENFFIGGLAKFGGPVAFGGAVTISDQTQSTNPSTGALKVSGGVGIGLNLNVGGAATIGLMTTVFDSTESVDTLSGALKVLGGVGIRKRLNVGGHSIFFNTLTVEGQTSINNKLNVSNSNSFVANFVNTSNQHGIRIQVANGAPGWSNNLMEFRNSSSGVVGRIEGENGSEYQNNPAYGNEIDFFNFRIQSAFIAVGAASATLAIAIKSLAGAYSSSTGCAGLGFCATAPIASLAVKASVDLVGALADVISNSVRTALAFADKDDYIAYKAAKFGVTYESGNGDYAEWLPKVDPEDKFLPGYIVGIQNGLISKSTEGAPKLMVISTQPLVLGNLPVPGLESRYEKVAFLGQVPVHVLGKVNAGDYILPSGLNDGFGRAVSPSNMQVEDYNHVVGVAWSSSVDEAYSLINVAVGLNGNDISKVVVNQKNRIQVLMEKFDQRNAILAKLVPGYKEAAGLPTSETLSQTLSNAIAKNGTDNSTTTFNKDDFYVLEFSKAQLSNILDQAQKIAMERGANLQSSSFWKRINSEPEYKDLFIQEIQQKAKMEIPKQLELKLKQTNNK